MPVHRNVLVIDDDRSFRRVLEAKLRRLGFAVEIARDRVSCMHDLLHHTFDLILLGVRVPETEDLELLSRLVALAPDTPVVVMTAYDEETLPERARAAGAAHVLYKPFDLDILGRIVTLHSEERRVRNATPASVRMCTIPLGHRLQVRFGSGEPATEVSAWVVSSQDRTFGIETDTPVPSELPQAVSIRMAGADGLYEFRARPLDADTAGFSLTLLKPRTIRRTQRRRHPRASMRVPVDLDIAANPSLKPRSESRRSDAGSHSWEDVPGVVSRDIGIGGIAILSPRALTAGATARAKWNLPAPEGSMPVTASGHVVRCELLPGAMPVPVFKIVVRFRRLRPEVRASLGEYVGTGGAV